MNIKESPSGVVVKTASGYEAFLPHPLPPHITWNMALVTTLSKADRILGMLAREGARLPDPHLLIRPFVSREAVLSSKIEGTRTTLGEIFVEASGGSVERSADDMQEVRNYIDALDFGVARLAEMPISLRLIREIHEKLMNGVRGSHATPGQFRTVQNWIGAPGSTIATASYVPPVPADLAEVLKDFEAFLHDHTLPPLVHVALCHYQFEAIHPFIDGNGRMGRLIIMLLLIERKVLPAPLLYLSAFFEASRGEYYQRLYQVSSSGSWLEWLYYFLNGVALQAQDVLSRTERINQLLTEWRAQVGGKVDSIPQKLLVQCCANPYLSAKLVAEQYDVAFTTAQRAIETLEELGILFKSAGDKRNRMYCATRIMAILDEPTLMEHDGL
ncbi:MAG: Fido protein [Candidatus Dependentiae bacterium]|nr:Fido protein [Candidatus Dependentiae bacterium]